MLISFNSLRNHVVCRVASVADMYSASVVNKETTLCFRDCHEIGVAWKQWTVPVIDFLLLAKSASLKTLRGWGCCSVCGLCGYRSPWVLVPLRYRSRVLSAC